MQTETQQVQQDHFRIIWESGLRARGHVSLTARERGGLAIHLLTGLGKRGLMGHIIPLKGWVRSGPHTFPAWG